MRVSVFAATDPIIDKARDGGVERALTRAAR
jgi:hypothetical protein